MVDHEFEQKKKQLHKHLKRAAEIAGDLGLVFRDGKYVDRGDIPDPEVKRMRTDQIERLYARNQISDDQRNAAVEIRKTFEAITRGMFPGKMSVERGGGSNKVRHPLERLSKSEWATWRYNYRPFFEGASKIAAFEIKENGQIVFRKTIWDVVSAVIIEGYGPSQLEKLWRLPRGNGRVTAELRRALNLYHQCRQPAPEQEIENLYPVRKATIADIMPITDYMKEKDGERQSGVICEPDEGNPAESRSTPERAGRRLTLGSASDSGRSANSVDPSENIRKGPSGQ